ncbi:hypothetical protein KCU71_g10794, partial [Aureobasidium melanogenum]
MSDTSYDSIDSMDQAIEDTSIALSNDEVQIESPDENGKHIQVEQEEVENEEIVNPADQVSDSLGYPNATTMVTKIDNVHHRLLALGPNLSQEEIRTAKQSVQHHEEAVAEMQHIVKMPLSRAVRFMDNVRDELLKTDHFPQTNLKAELGKIVKSHLRAAILKRAHEQKEAELLQKLNFDRQKASEEFKEELKGAGLMD